MVKWSYYIFFFLIINSYLLLHWSTWRFQNLLYGWNFINASRETEMCIRAAQDISTFNNSLWELEDADVYMLMKFLQVHLNHVTLSSLTSSDSCS